MRTNLGIFTPLTPEEWRRLCDTLVVFERPEDIEPWAMCNVCALRGPDDQIMDDDAQCLRCGGIDWYPVGTNYVVTCPGCEQDGCNASDCVTFARDGSCPLCGSTPGVTVRQGYIAEPIDNFHHPWENRMVDYVQERTAR